MPPTLYWGQPEWASSNPTEDPTERIWKTPEMPGVRAEGMLDFRSLAQKGTPGPTQQGFAIFTYSDAIVSPPPSLTLLGQPDELVAKRDRSKIEGDLGFANNSLRSGTVIDVVLQIAFELSDPDFGAMGGTIMPGHRRQMELHIPGTRSGPRGNNRVWVARFKDTEAYWSRVQKQHQNNYKAIADRVAANADINGVPGDLHRKYLWNAQQKLGHDWRELKPPPSEGYPDEEPVHPTTQITDDFDGADAAGIGNQQTWTEVSSTGDWFTRNNGARQNATNANGTARCESDLSTNDQTVTVDVTWNDAANSRRLGTAVQFDSSADTMLYGCGDTSLNTDRLFDVTTGTHTELTSQAHTIGAETLTVTTQVDGTTLGVTVGAASELTDTSFTDRANTRCGIAGRSGSTGSRWAEAAGGTGSTGQWDAQDLATTPDFYYPLFPDSYPQEVQSVGY